MKGSKIQFYFLAYRPRDLVNGKKAPWKPVFHHPPLHHTLREARERYSTLLLTSSLGQGQNEYKLRPVNEKEKWK